MDYFEDFYINQRIPFGRYTVTEAEIVEFAKHRFLAQCTIQRQTALVPLDPRIAAGERGVVGDVEVQAAAVIGLTRRDPLLDLLGHVGMDPHDQFGAACDL